VRAAEFSQHLPFRRLGHEFGIFTLALSDDNDDGIVYSMSNPSEFFAQYLPARTTENPMCIQKEPIFVPWPTTPRFTRTIATAAAAAASFTHSN
jgi:hypothetical protein